MVTGKGMRYFLSKISYTAIDFLCTCILTLVCSSLVLCKLMHWYPWKNQISANRFLSVLKMPAGSCYISVCRFLSFIMLQRWWLRAASYSFRNQWEFLATFVVFFFQTLWVWNKKQIWIYSTGLFVKIVTGSLLVAYRVIWFLYFWTPGCY